MHVVKTAVLALVAKRLLVQYLLDWAVVGIFSRGHYQHRHLHLHLFFTFFQPANQSVAYEAKIHAVYVPSQSALYGNRKLCEAQNFGRLKSQIRRNSHENQKDIGIYRYKYQV